MLLLKMDMLLLINFPRHKTNSNETLLTIHKMLSEKKYPLSVKIQCGLNSGKSKALDFCMRV